MTFSLVHLCHLLLCRHCTCVHFRRALGSSKTVFSHWSSHRVAPIRTLRTQPITSVYLLHSGYADHHVERAYNSIDKIQKSTKNMQIVGGDFNAKLGPGIGIERLSVGPHTFKESNSRGDCVKQWLMLQKFVALNTVYRKTPEKTSYIQDT